MKKALAAVFGSMVLALILLIWIMSFGGGGSLIPSGPRSSPESSLTRPPPRVVNTSSSSPASSPFQLVEHAELCRRDWSHWTRAQRESHEYRRRNCTQFFSIKVFWSWISIQCIYIVLEKWLKGGAREFWVGGDQFPNPCKKLSQWEALFSTTYFTLMFFQGLCILD